MCSGNCNCGNSDLSSFSADKSCNCNSGELISRRNYFKILSGPVYEFGIGNLTPNAILGTGNEVQAPVCNPNNIEVPAGCSDSDHVNGGNCYEGLKCSNITGHWCWTSDLGCSITTGGSGVKHIVPPLL